MDPDAGALKNFKDFLQLYNKMTEMCFKRCIDNLNSRKLDPHELACVEDCSQKFILYNNKLMQNFVRAQSEIMNKRMKEAEEQSMLDSEEQKKIILI
ncbi:translocase of inner membrane 9b [Rhynchophorus ferrugineus]|uniref:translocase of inner membrane 9b n=1 Tax=Rhynchophorus ferrugineus TaxID=354439 RepID=UPI003FCD984A